MALGLLDATETECLILNSRFLDRGNDTRKCLNIIMFIFRRIWSRFTGELATVATFNARLGVDEYADLLSQEQLRLHLDAYWGIYQRLQDDPALLAQDVTNNIRIREAYSNVTDMLPTMCFLLNAKLLAYILSTNNGDRERANEVAHPSLEVIEESLRDLNADPEDFTDQASVIFQAMIEPTSASRQLLTSATELMATTVLGHFQTT